MLKVIQARIRQGYRTQPFPRRPPVLSDRYRGCPQITPGACPADCRACEAVCPTGALGRGGPDGTGALRIDLGRCIFCGRCESECAGGGVRFTGEYRMAVRERADLELSGERLKLAGALDRRLRRLFGRSLKLRQVSAGGCNACEADTNVLNTPAFDLGRFGIQFVASPRHADGLLVTGPVTCNMELALRKTLEAVPEPRLVIAVGACAISGGLYAGSDETCAGIPRDIPVDLYIPGCPPNPWTILDGLLRLLGRI